MSETKRDDGEVIGRGSTDETDPLVDIGKAAEFFAVGRATLYRLVAARRIPCVRIGGAIRVRITEVEAALRCDVSDSEREQQG